VLNCPQFYVLSSLVSADIEYWLWYGAFSVFDKPSAVLPAFIYCAACKIRLSASGEISNEIYAYGRSLRCSDHRPNQHSVSTILLLWVTRRHLPRFAPAARTSRSILLQWITRRHLLRSAAASSRFGSALERITMKSRRGGALANLRHRRQLRLCRAPIRAAMMPPKYSTLTPTSPWA
jgi:hypothetical protein